MFVTSTMAMLILLTMARTISGATDSAPRKPNIIFVLADDLGWADVSFHGSTEIPTPNLDALAADGVVLNSHYTQPVCAPSRAALLTGLYPLRFGLQEGMLYPSAPGGVPVNITLLPQHFRRLGYKSHIVGKWHLGCSSEDLMPTNRGFDSHLGYLNHGEDYITHTVIYNGSCGYDFWFNEEVLTDAHGIYSMDLFLNRAKGIIADHDPSKVETWFRYGKYSKRIFRMCDPRRWHKVLFWPFRQPLFLYLSMQAPHIGSATRLFAPPEENIAKFPHIRNANRAGYAALIGSEGSYKLPDWLKNAAIREFDKMAEFDSVQDSTSDPHKATVDTLDQATGAVVEALYEKGMLGDSVIVFSSDNGARSEGMGSDWPLRGAKHTLWEGGVRVPAFIWSPLLRDREKRVSFDVMHLVDWMPTLYQAAGGKSEDLGAIDGVSQWNTLLSGSKTPARQELLHDFNPVDGSGAYRSGRYKLVVVPSDGSWEDRRLQPFGEGPSDVDLDGLTAESKVAEVLSKFHAPRTARAATPEWRRTTTVSCEKNQRSNFESAHSPYLFDIVDDPCELRNLAQEQSDIVDTMMRKLAAAADIAAPLSTNAPDPKAYPQYNNCTWGPRRNVMCSSDLQFCSATLTNNSFSAALPRLSLVGLCLAYLSRNSIP